MKIAIPMAGNEVSLHFGHSETFLFYTVNPDTKEIESEEQMTPPEHAPGVIPKWVADQGASVVVTGGIGGRAKDIFNHFGVQVVSGARSSNPREVVAAYLEGSLEIVDNSCSHH